MMNLLHELRSQFEPVLLAIAPDAGKVPDYLLMIKSINVPKNGDYQANFAMPLAKVLGRKPQELAADIVSMLPTDELIASATVAGPGFINITISNAWLAGQVRLLADDERMGVQANAVKKRYVVDYSGPNVAKPLHVGHLRSTIIGDALIRILRFLGHDVIGDNHLGDWGTQFGILLYGYKHLLNREAYDANPVRELARLYVEVRRMAKAAAENPDDEGTGEIMELCRAETAKLHSGDAENRKLWHEFLPHCMAEIHAVYAKLNLLPFDHILGESFYHSMLDTIVKDCLQRGLAQESNGAVVLPNARGIIPDTTDELGQEEPPQLIRKRDGAYTYTTTDLATLQYRLEQFQPDTILYVVDARQSLHFRTLFANVKRWGYDSVELQHLQFGSVLGADRKPYGTRKGAVPELAELIEEAKLRALAKYEQSYAERSAHGHDVPELTLEFKQLIANAIGVGAMKYADLSGNRTSDYIFDYDKMLATDGNTASYLQYAYARCRSIIRKSGLESCGIRSSQTVMQLDHPHERSLALQLLKLETTLLEAGAKYEPHHIATYLWDLSKAFSGFFENCPVLTAATAELKLSRLLLVDQTSRTLKLALELLGIQTVEQM